MVQLSLWGEQNIVHDSNQYNINVTITLLEEPLEINNNQSNTCKFKSNWLPNEKKTCSIVLDYIYLEGHFFVNTKTHLTHKIWWAISEKKSYKVYAF